MSKTTSISLKLNGPHGSASLSDFAVAVNALRNSIRNVARCLTGEENVEYEVSHLKIGSAVIEAIPSDEWVKFGAEVADLFEGTVEALQDDRPIDPRIDFKTLSAFNGFSAIAKKPGVHISVGRTTITNFYAEKLALLLNPESTSMGSVSGRLEGISIHGGNRFVLYPPIPGEEVTCIFDSNDLPAVAEALGREVVVFGRLGYAKNKAFPVRVDVDEFEVMPRAEDLPTLLDACGSMHSPIKSIELIREVRDEWA